jgi:hypothetical protein
MSALLFLKITLAPALVGTASLAARRFGARVGGWLIGFPVVAGPVIWFYARQQGPAFAARAAAGTLLGVVSLCLFLLVYAWTARRQSWLCSLLLGWLSFVAATVPLAWSPAVRDAPWPVGLLAACAALTLTIRALPRVLPAAPAPRPRHDVLLRMLATALMVLALTGAAQLLGPALSGLFTPFPVATTVLVVFAHREGGPGGVIAVYGGFLPSLYSFAGFCAAVSWALARWPLAPALAFAVALLVALVCQTLVLQVLARVRSLHPGL